VFTPEDAVMNLTLQFSEMHLDGYSTIPATAFNCFNTGGMDQHGVQFSKQFSVYGRGAVGSMWVGIQLPTDMQTGIWETTMLLHAASAPTKRLMLTLNVTGELGAAHNSGDDDVYKMSRLRWLDSTIGIDDNVTQ
jgi:hypothetical protein